MAVAASSSLRIRADGKFFRLGDHKFHVKGVAYGPFAPNAAGEPFAGVEQTIRDFEQIRDLGGNLLRIYHPPARWFLDRAAEQGLRVLVDIPWNQHLCFLESSRDREQALRAVRETVTVCAGHPAVFAYSVANEIPADIVRWTGTRATSDFIDTLVEEAKRGDPGCLCCYGNFPPTEFLQPESVDFLCFNIYLHQRKAWRAYLARLQMLSDGKPLLVGEFGIDSLREGEPRKCEMLSWQIEEAFRTGAAGAILFSFTDDWHRDGRAVSDWQLGITDRDRQPKSSFAVVREKFRAAPRFPLRSYPRVSVVVASYNAERTLKACLESLQQLDYPDYEVILVDDGSTDRTQAIAADFPRARYIPHPRNFGLSVARNTGIAAATGEIVAFTDADCRVDEDWLYYLVGELLDSDFAAVGGPNLLPPDDSAVAAAVMASPGGPAHVMLNDRVAEHIPGCNMAFYKWALVGLGGFDPIFERAGDDVDVCWRLQQAGWNIGFSAAGFVWHYRRSTIRDYLKQQRGYGEAEALLVRKHPEYFNTFGGSMWRGRIYTSARMGLMLRPAIIYRGLFGSAGYQALYAPAPASNLMLCTTLEYHALITLPLWVLSASFHPLIPLAITSLLVPLAVCSAAAAQAVLPPGKDRWWSRPLIAALFFLQPLVRGWARYQGRLAPRPKPALATHSLDSMALRESHRRLGEVAFWSEKRIDRIDFVRDLLRRLDEQGWPNRADIGWSDFDVEVYGPRWCKVQLMTAAEYHTRGRTLLRIRLRGRWSMRATLCFWALLGADLAVLGLTHYGRPWLWLILVVLPLFAWFLHHQQRNIHSLLLVFLDQMAKEWSLAKVQGEQASTVRQPPSPELLAHSPFRGTATGAETPPSR